MRKFQFAAWAIFISIIVIIFSLWVLLHQFQRRSEAAQLDPYTLIPSDAWLVIDLKQTNELASFFLVDSLRWAELESLNEVRWLKEQLHRVDTFVADHPEINTAIKTSRLVVSVHTPIRGQAPVLLQLRFGPEESIRRIQRFFYQQLEQGPNYNQYRFLGATIHQNQAEGEKSYFFSFYRGSLLFGPSQRLIEHAIAQEVSGSALAAMEKLSLLRSVAGRRSNNIFFDGSRFCEVMEKLLTADTPSLFPCQSFSGWLGWDFALLGEEIRLTGFAKVNVEEPDFLGLFSGQKAVDPTLLNYIPSASAAFALLNIDKEEEMAGSLAFFRNRITGREAADSALHKALSPHFGSSVASVLLYAPDLSSAKASIALMHVKEAPLLWEKINDRRLWETNEPTVMPVDTVFEQVIWQFLPPGLVPALSMGLITAELPFVVLLDSVLLAGATPQALNRALMQIHYGQIIGKEPRLSEDFIFQQPASNLLYMLNMPYLAGMLQGNWSQAAINLLGQIGQGAYPLDRLTAQFAAHRNGLFFSNVSLHRHGAKISSLQKPLWEVKLDTLAQMGPVSVFNHNDGSREIVIQDLKNNFYLVDRFGNVLWKKEISGPINSRVYQVDIYKNKRYQYLFSTRNFLHLIDRNGNYVRGFPRRLPSAAVAGITLLDYDLDKNYRVLFPGEDRRIYNLGLDGRRVSGWLMPRLENQTGGPLQYLRLAERDYLVVVDEEGRPGFFDRRGQKRLEIPDTFRLSPKNPVHTLEPNAGNYFVALGKEGEVLEIKANGEVNAFILDSLFADAGFLVLSPGEDKEPIFIFSSQSNLKAFDQIGTPVFTHSLAGKVSPPILEVYAAKKQFFALTTQNPEQLFLFDHEGRLVPPFPIKGDQMFVLESLLQDQAWNVVTVQGDRLVTYLIGGL